MIALIPARGGSTRIPRKNLSPIGRETLLSRCIRKLRVAGLEVVVSTEDDEISCHAETHGARVHRRSLEAASDTATLEDVIVDWLPTSGLVGDSRRPGEDLFVVAQCTSPFVPVAAYRAATERPSCAVRHLPDGEWAAAITDDRVLCAQSTWRPRTQDVNLYTDCGAVYSMLAGQFDLEEPRRYEFPRAIVLSKMESWDIDTPEDLEVARLWAAAGAL